MCPSSHPPVIEFQRPFATLAMSGGGAGAGSIEARVRALQKLSRSCFNCDTLGTAFVVPQFSIFVCTECSGKHMLVGHRVKSVSMGKFSAEEVKALEDGGNQKAAKLFLANWKADKDVGKPVDRDAKRVEAWIRAVLVERRFYADASAGQVAGRTSGSGIPIKDAAEVLGPSLKLQVGAPIAHDPSNSFAPPLHPSGAAPGQPSPPSGTRPAPSPAPAAATAPRPQPAFDPFNPFGPAPAPQASRTASGSGPAAAAPPGSAGAALAPAISTPVVDPFNPFGPAATPASGAVGLAVPTLAPPASAISVPAVRLLAPPRSAASAAAPGAPPIAAPGSTTPPPIAALPAAPVAAAAFDPFNAFSPSVAVLPAATHTHPLQPVNGWSNSTTHGAPAPTMVAASQMQTSVNGWTAPALGATPASPVSNTGPGLGAGRAISSLDDWSGFEAAAFPQPTQPASAAGSRVGSVASSGRGSFPAAAGHHAAPHLAAAVTQTPQQQALGSWNAFDDAPAFPVPAALQLAAPIANTAPAPGPGPVTAMLVSALTPEAIARMTAAVPTAAVVRAPSPGRIAAAKAADARASTAVVRAPTPEELHQGRTGPGAGGGAPGAAFGAPGLGSGAGAGVGGSAVPPGSPGKWGEFAAAGPAPTPTAGASGPGAQGAIPPAFAPSFSFGPSAPWPSDVKIPNGMHAPAAVPVAPATSTAATASSPLVWSAPATPAAAPAPAAPARSGGSVQGSGGGTLSGGAGGVRAELPSDWFSDPDPAPAPATATSAPSLPTAAAPAYGAPEAGPAARWPSAAMYGAPGPAAGAGMGHAGSGFSSPGPYGFGLSNGGTPSAAMGAPAYSMAPAPVPSHGFDFPDGAAFLGSGAPGALLAPSTSVTPNFPPPAASVMAAHAPQPKYEQQTHGQQRYGQQGYGQLGLGQGFGAAPRYALPGSAPAPAMAPLKVSHNPFA